MVDLVFHFLTLLIIRRGISNNGKRITFYNNNIGILTGAISKTIVIDLDSEEAVVWLKSKGEVPTTWLAKTGRGFHLYFNYKQGVLSGKLHSVREGKILSNPCERVAKFSVRK
ncbi:bifunctional DNA primase/polymerase [Fictibacillus sp. WQ 8-8]|uniref:bifunctional DNA primase/polymerase n=1 Tax=Fictibacillus sp. WQ 8-8 TaxID=2938788 RepID=UPI00210BCD6F|nr:bifunctional DNA primase/polymerase [Fictibacillus sp. WQ 8-8]MCQ6264501.1 bifunctional DNA primase/polymerase [Fictibacillus sp. WQ 8-8]